MTELRMTSTIGLPASRHQAEQWSLVLRAANIPSVVEFERRSWVIKVSPLHEQRALQEIAAFMAENSDWPPDRPQDKPTLPVLTKYQPPTILMMGALVIFYIITGPWSENSVWFSVGSVSGRQILENGQWFRLVTALTLHADVVHLVGNILIGGILVHFLCRLLGNGLGWFLILASGTLGNLMNILLHGTSHNSVGFSTAVFGTIGILSGYQAASKRTAALKEILLPLAAGAGLLAFLGAGGPRTDLGAHFFGLLAGAVLGGLLVFLPSQQILIKKSSLQASLFISSLTIVGLSWWFAMG
ncbi:MAG: rhomboid family intramembrane serine protease [Deltaproteobacteria bacterium]|jgi:membrane associated rhomboid family serine protease|nr:rhomboid family intramembrane serine protease [Deltaproteobacteria bacterium]